MTFDSKYSCFEFLFCRMIEFIKVDFLQRTYIFVNPESRQISQHTEPKRRGIPLWAWSLFHPSPCDPAGLNPDPDTAFLRFQDVGEKAPKREKENSQKKLINDSILTSFLLRPLKISEAVQKWRDLIRDRRLKKTLQREERDDLWLQQVSSASAVHGGHFLYSSRQGRGGHLLTGPRPLSRGGCGERLCSPPT